MCLNADKDIYGCVKIQSVDPRHLSDEDFRQTVQDSLVSWKSKNVRGIWFKVRLEDSRMVPILAELGFIFHHAQPDYLMMCKWLPENIPCTLPKYPHMAIGCGGLVVDSQDRILLMREKKGFYLGWKFPGGLAEPNENIFETAAREVKEETGVDTVGVTVLSIRQIASGIWRNTNDLYWLCVMHPKDENNIEVHACPTETAEARWHTRDEIAALPDEMFHYYLRKAINQHDSWRVSGASALTMKTVNSPFRRMDMHLFTVEPQAIQKM